MEQKYFIPGEYVAPACVVREIPASLRASNVQVLNAYTREDGCTIVRWRNQDAQYGTHAVALEHGANGWFWGHYALTREESIDDFMRRAGWTS